MRLTLFMLVSIALFGCGGGDGLNRQPVQGTVLLDGEPLVRGAIRFEPLVQGTGSGTVIQAGAYTLDSDVGLPPGEYRVSITAAAVTAQEPSMESDQPGAGDDLIPPRYNTQTTLMVKVSDNDSNTFDFSLQSGQVAPR